MCDYRPDRAIVHLGIEFGSTNTSLISRTSAELGNIASHGHIGYMAHHNRLQSRLIMTKNPGVTGPGGPSLPWRVQLMAGAPREFTIDHTQIRRGHFQLLVIEYPPGTTFDVVATQRYNIWPPGPHDHVIPMAASLAEVMNATEPLPHPDNYVCPDTYRANICNTGTVGPRYFFDGRFLYLRVVNMLHYVDRYRGQSAQPDYDSFHGMQLTNINNFFTWRVRASCTPVCAGSPVCGVPVCLRNTSYSAYDIPPAAVDFCAARPGADVGCPDWSARDAFYACFNGSSSGTPRSRAAACRQAALDAYTNDFGATADAEDLADTLEAEAVASTGGGGGGDADSSSSTDSSTVLVGAVVGAVAAVAIVVAVVAVVLKRHSRQPGPPSLGSCGGSRSRVSPSSSSMASNTSESALQERPVESVWLNY